MKVYCISGLGADHRIFNRLDVPGAEFVPLPWLSPLSGERIEGYAARMRDVIPERDPVLLGVSFGGMMAIEIARELPEATVILVSSIRHRRHMPWWMRLGSVVRLDSLMPARAVKRGAFLGRLENYMLGVENADDAELCLDFRRRVDRGYLNWAIRMILRWQNEWKPSSFYHIHGDKDRIFPMRKVGPTHIVRNGGHLMIYNHAKELNRLLNGILGTLQTPSF